MAHETLTVALDRNAYEQRELDQLEDLVRDAAESGMERAEIGLNSGGADILVRDVAADPHLAPAIMRAGKADGAKIETTPATSFWIEYSATALNAYEAGHFPGDASRLEGMIQRLRTPLPGVSIAQDGDGAIVRADDPSFEDVLGNTLGRMFAITPLGKSSWRVTWIDAVWMKFWSPAKLLDAKLHTADMLRQSLGDPMELEVYETPTGAYFAVRDPDRHKPFIEAIERTFHDNRDFALREAPAEDIRLSAAEEKPLSGNHGAPITLPLAPEHSKLIDDVETVVDPPADIRMEGDAVLVKAKVDAQKDDLDTIVRDALKGRDDLTIASQVDGSLRIEIAPDHRLGPPIPEPTREQLLQAVESRLNDAGLHALKISALDDENLNVTFESDTEGSVFRAALANPSGLVMRLVDEEFPGKSGPSTLPPGEEKLKLPSGEEIWLKPEAIVTGDMIADARAAHNKYTDEPLVQFRLNAEGKARFALATRLNVGRRFAVVVDGKALSAPVIREPIVGGVGEISGNFTNESAKATAASIMAHRNDLPLTITGEAHE